jgi:hypothetical protein
MDEKTESDGVGEEAKGGMVADPLETAMLADPNTWLAALPEAFDRESIRAQWWAMHEECRRMAEMRGKPLAVEVKSVELADLLGFTSQYTAELVNKGILRKVGRGKFILRESVRNYVAMLKGEKRMATGTRGGEEAAGPVGTYEADKARKMKADADLAEITAAKAAGKLVVAKFVGAAWANGIGIVMTKLGSIGQKVGALVILERTPKGAAEIIDKEIRAACQSLYEMDIAAVAVAEQEAEELKEKA